MTFGVSDLQIVTWTVYEDDFGVSQSDMEFVQKFTPLDFQVKNFTPSILPNFNSFSKKKTQKMSENGEIYTTGKNFTLPPALTAWTNSTSEDMGSDIIFYRIAVAN